MSSGNPLDGRRKAAEEEYFRKQEADKLAKLKEELAKEKAGKGKTEGNKKTPKN